MTRDTIIITTPPQTLRSVQGWDVTPGHLAYRVGRGPHLFRAAAAQSSPGAGSWWWTIRASTVWGDPGPLCQEVVRECSARGFTGAVLDFDAKLPPLERMAATLEEGFARRGWTLYVPESYGARLQRARVMISSALSGGSLALRLEEASGLLWGGPGGSGAPEGGGGLCPAFIHRQRAAPDQGRTGPEKAADEPLGVLFRRALRSVFYLYEPGGWSPLCPL